MKKILYLLLIACIMVACSKDDGNPTPEPTPIEPPAEQPQRIDSISSLYNTAWTETNWFEFKYYDTEGNFIKESDYEGCGIDGPTYSILLTEEFVGWWIPTGSNGPQWKPYTYGTTNYEFSQEDGVLKIGDIECDLHNFTAEYIELTCTIPTYDNMYCVRRIRLTPRTEQRSWDKWVSIFDGDNATWEANQQ